MVETSTQNPRFIGQIISGKFGEVIARLKSGAFVEVGEIVVVDSDSESFLMQIYDIQYGSQISQQNLELMSGLALEEDTALEIHDKHMRQYTLAWLKNLITIPKISSTSVNASVIMTKSLPPIFSMLRSVETSDLTFLSAPKNALYLGQLRSGSKSLDVPIAVDGEKVLSHHVLITGTTGKGKSVLMSNHLWELASKEYAATLILDPHDEYFGRTTLGLKDHPSKKVLYYTSKNVPPGGRSLKIPLKLLRPHHFDCLDFSDAQFQAMNAYYRDYGQEWIESIIIDKPLSAVKFNDATVNVLKRRLMQLLDIEVSDAQVFCNGIFSLNSGETIVSDIVLALESASSVVIDTSSFSGHVELLIGSILVTELFSKYKHYKLEGSLGQKPIISIVLEEAPRVLGKQVLERGSNIFATIAREGRKFNVGLIAITQLPSLIPREILANMNTKIILGTEMNQERQAIIESASQDLSTDSRAIASLDKGECIVSTNFARFALPLKIPFFETVAKSYIAQQKSSDSARSARQTFSGVNIQ